VSTIDPYMSASAGAGVAASPYQSLGPFLRAIGRHWLLVLVVGGLAGGISVATVLQHKASYEASVSVLVKPLPQDDATFIGIGTIVDSVDPTRTIQTAAALISTPTAAEAAAKKMGPGWTGTRVKNAVRVQPRGESFLLDIIATGSSGDQAARLADAYADAALAARAKLFQTNLSTSIDALRGRIAKLRQIGADSTQINDLSGRFEQLRALQVIGADPSLQLSERADPTGGPIGKSRVLLAILAVISGLVLGSIAALAIEFFTRRLRDEDEIQRLYPIPILAGIPKIRRGRVQAQAFPSHAFEQVRLLRVQLPIGDVPKSFMITSANSGDGKTTTASALAMAIALGDQDVILLDLDMRKPGPTSMFGVARSVHAPRTLEDMLEPVPGLPRLRVMPAPLGDALALDLFLRDLPNLLAEAKQMASCVIVDAAPIGEVSDVLRIATACDHALFIARPRHTDRGAFILTRDLLTRAGITPLGIVVIGQRIAGVSQHYAGYETTGITPAHQQGTTAPRVGALESLSGAQLNR
jgi:Mrp family chromosome partitioning ATPase/capsular polysaccharide biosynthesis protein